MAYNFSISTSTRAGWLPVVAALLPLAFGQAPIAVQPGEGQAKVLDAAAAPPSQPAEYMLQAGDELEIRVYNLPELTQKVKIRPDGRISVVLLDELMAAGSTSSNLTEIIRKGYSSQFRNPRVTVIVTSFTNQNVFVGGEVNQPRMIALSGRLSASAAVFYAGGLKSTAKVKEVIILSNSGKNEVQLTRLNLEQVLNKGTPDIELKPFDVVFVPKSRIAKIDQFMDQYIKQLQPIALNLGFSYLLGQNFQIAIP